MTHKEMAIAIATAVIQFQMSKQAFDAVVRHYRASGKDIEWEQMIENTTNHLLTSENIQRRIDRLNNAFHASTDDAQLIHALHRELLDHSLLPY